MMQRDKQHLDNINDQNFADDDYDDVLLPYSEWIGNTKSFVFPILQELHEQQRLQAIREVLALIG